MTGHITINSVISSMKRGAVQAMIARPGMSWSLDDGTSVPNTLAATIIELPEIVSGGDGLLDDVIVQIYRHVAVLR